MQLFFLAIVLWRTSEAKITLSSQEMTVEELNGKSLPPMLVQRRYLHMKADELEEYQSWRETSDDEKMPYNTTQY